MLLALEIHFMIKSIYSQSLVFAFTFYQSIMMIVNINYRGSLAKDDFKKISFNDRLSPPRQRVFKTKSSGTMIAFPSGKFRLMGLRKPLENLSNLPFLPESIQLQSCTVVDDLEVDVNLLLLAHLLSPKRCTFEPEIFPAVRLIEFKPLCVNVFSSGKLVLMGVRDLDHFPELLRRVKSYVYEVLSDYFMSLI